MPAEIDRAERLDDIARAVLEIAREHGGQAVTVRAVAARLGGSTTLVTKYLPSRPALLANALRYVRENWAAESAAGPCPGPLVAQHQRLRRRDPLPVARGPCRR